MTHHKSWIINYLTDSQPWSLGKRAGPEILQDQGWKHVDYLNVAYTASGLTDIPKVLCLMFKMAQFA